MTRIMDWLNADSTPDAVAAFALLSPLLLALSVMIYGLSLIPVLY